ncbi:MAG: hypothetical protein ATN35_07865 [Epulopiscium sp. Nele67-Bin004]|nr:MAG: hypothetical protein ATN35_07865 [Epulopiscium sp. Nele67-Bin004]
MPKFILMFITMGLISLPSIPNTTPQAISSKIPELITQVNQVTEEEQFIHDTLEEEFKIFRGSTWSVSEDKVLGVKHIGDYVTVDLDSQMTNYGGGTAIENFIGGVVMDVVFSNTDAEEVSITVAGEVTIFPEGSDFQNITRLAFERYYKENYRVE